ncbi:hypothetical protein [Halioxenophilus sp. WMMB6]|uniref:hypothetical protein n=1 Tax=Halioxenophilus sp. WMMB6 TaxID=3073815 RepID=UPI00295E7E28|nr:hypothetical protein [Halioxenophilus sp. WMMB6]
MTECNQISIDFPSVEHRKVDTDFSSGDISIHGDAMLLHQIYRRLNLCRRVARAMGDDRARPAANFRWKN